MILDTSYFLPLARIEVSSDLLPAITEKKTREDILLEHFQEFIFGFCIEYTVTHFLKGALSIENQNVDLLFIQERKQRYSQHLRFLN